MWVISRRSAGRFAWRVLRILLLLLFLGVLLPRVAAVVSEVFLPVPVTGEAGGDGGWEGLIERLKDYFRVKNG